jgi:hypothetical protein
MDLSNKTNDELKSLILEVCDKVVEDSNTNVNENMGRFDCPFCNEWNNVEEIELIQHKQYCVWKLCYDILYTH